MLSENTIKTIVDVNADEVLELEDMNEVAKYLVEDKKVFRSNRDLVLFILDYAEKAIKIDNVEVPVRYYAEGEEIDTSPVEEMVGENLTDEFIKNKFS